MAHHRSLRTVLLAGTVIAGPALAAEVTPARLANPEPQNWLMNHRTYDGQRFSPLDKINKSNVEEPQAPLHRGAGRRRRQSVRAGDPARRGRLHLHHGFGGRALQDRRHLRRRRPHRLAHGPRPAAPGPQPRRRAVGQSRHHRRQGPAAHHRDQQGQRPRRVGNRLPRYAGRRVDLGTAPDQGQDHRRRRRRGRGRARLDRRARRRDRQDAVAPLHGAGARRARQRDLEGQEQRLADRRRRGVGDRDLRSRDQPDDLGHRQPGADVRPDLSAGRQPLHQQRDLLGSRHRQDELVLPVHARRHVGLRRGRHPHPDQRQYRAGSRAS